MSLNNLMHPRNIYKNNSPDFKELANKYEYFRSLSRENTNGDVSIDFKKPEALRALLYALLDNDFDIKLDIPLDRLIPTLPLRLNYIHWIEDLLKFLDQDETVIGLDIGTGASCIYPLLGTKLNGWKFLATEVDESSLRYAQYNVQQNQFTDNIRVHLVSEGSYLCKSLEDCDMKTASFCMCNPPFFSSEEEAMLGASRTDKRPLPISVNTGSSKETVTTGGEVEFVKGIIEDSLKLKQKISWYTSMLGKKSSIKSVVAYLKEKQVSTITTTTFCQGKTMRWGVAWSFIPDIAVDRSTGPSPKRKKKETKSLSFNIPKDSPALPCDEMHSRFERALKWFDDILLDLKIVINERQLDNAMCRWQCSAPEVTWSNQRRKRREQKRSTSCLGNASAVMEISDGNDNEKEPNPSTDQSNVEETHKDVVNQEQLTTRSYLSEERNVIPEGNAVQNDINGPQGVVTSPNIGAPSSDKTSGSDKTSSSDKTSGNTIPGRAPVGESLKETSGTPLCMFWVCLDAKGEPVDNELYVQIGCIQAANTNHVYQFYQFLQNKLVKAL